MLDADDGVPGVDRLHALLPDERAPEEEPIQALVSGRPVGGEKSRVIYRSAQTNRLTSAAILVESVDATDRARQERPATALAFSGTQESRDQQVEVWPGGDPDTDEDGDPAAFIRSRWHEWRDGKPRTRTKVRGRPVAIYHPGGRHEIRLRVEGLDEDEAERLAESLAKHARNNGIREWNRRRRSPPTVTVEGPDRLRRRDLEAQHE